MGSKYSEGMEYKVIAFILACFTNDDQLRVMKKIAHDCSEHKCKVIFYSTVSDFYFNNLVDTGEKKIFDTISVEKYDAIVLMSGAFTENEEQTAMLEKAHKAGVPVIAVDKSLDGCINLTFDYGDTFRDIVKHMVEYHGYRTINFMGGMPGNSYSDDRLQCFKEVLAENNIPFNPKRVYYGYFWDQPTVTAMDKMFADGLSMPEAIICANDAMAITVCNYLQEQGYRVPEDIAVSGFDGIDMERYNRPRLTTGVYNVEKFIDIMFDIVTNKDTVYKENNRIPVFNKMQLGRSCGCSACETVNIGSAMLTLKVDLQREIKNQMIQSQMVAKYGNSASLREVINAIPQYMPPLRYKDFWFCANENLVEDAELYYEHHENVFLEDHPNFTKTMNVLHYRNERQKPYINYRRKIQFGDLIPDLKKELEKNDYLLVLSVNLKNEAAGYAVVSFDAETFLYTAYMCFITNFRYLLEMQKVQMKMMQFYRGDCLTGLYNRTGFNQKVQAMMDDATDEQQLSIISLDMDGLKRVNDTYGHSEGDEALKVLGKIIKDSTDREIAARIGGDEFLIAFAGDNVIGRTEEIVARIKHGIGKYNANNKKQYEIHASIGSYTDCIKDHTMDDFLLKVDNLMYERKALHKQKNRNIS